jgi:ABC-type sugar transport system substrate-binding protein
MYLLVLLPVAGCDTASAPTHSRPAQPTGARVVFVGPSQFDPQWPAIRGGAGRAARHLPMLNLECLAPPDETAAALLRTVQRTLDSKPSVVCLYINDVPAARPCIDAIAARGVLLVTVGLHIENVSIYGHVDVPIPACAELIGENLREIAAGRASYVLVHEHGRNSVATACYERFKLSADRQHAVACLDERNAAQTHATQRDLVLDLLRQFRYAGLVITFSPEAWIEAPARLTIGPANRFIAMPAIPALWPALRDDQALALVGPLDGQIGYLAVSLAAEALTQSRGFGVLRSVACEVVTARTLDDFSRRYAAAADMSLEDLLPTPASAAAATGRVKDAGGRPAQP